jgi:hypothetical protein
MDFNSCAIGERSLEFTQKQAAREIPAPGAGLIARERPKSRQSGAKPAKYAEFGPKRANGEWQIANSEWGRLFAIRYSPLL